jgi:hypothetical protein
MSAMDATPPPRPPTPPTDEVGRFVWMVTWGRPGRADWQAALVLAYDVDEARAVAAASQPGRLRPQEAFLADEATARTVLTPDADAPPILRFPVLNT